MTDSTKIDHLGSEGNEQEEKKSRSGQDLLDHLEVDSDSNKNIKTSEKTKGIKTSESKKSTIRSKSAKGIKNNKTTPANTKLDKIKRRRLRRMVYTNHRSNKMKIVNNSKNKEATFTNTKLKNKQRYRKRVYQVHQRKKDKKWDIVSKGDQKSRDIKRYEQIRAKGPGQKHHQQIEQQKKDLRRVILKRRQRALQKSTNMSYKGDKNVIGKKADQGSIQSQRSGKINGNDLFANKSKSTQQKEKTQAAQTQHHQKQKAQIKNHSDTQAKNVRKNGIRTTIKRKKKEAKQKVDASRKRNFLPKIRLRATAAHYLVDKFGRDEEGNPNMFGLLSSIIFLIIFVVKLVKLIITFIKVIIVIVIVAIVISLFAYIISLFTVRTDEIRIEEAFSHISYVVARRNKDVYDTYQSLVEEKEDGTYDEVLFKVNGIEADPEEFMYVAQGDTFLYYLNAKFEDYETDTTRPILNRSMSALRDAGVSNPVILSNFIHTRVAGDPENTRITTVQDEIRAVQNALFNHSVEIEENKEIERTVVTFDEESGEERTEVTREVIDVATVNVNIKTMEEFLDSDPQMEISAQVGGGTVNIQVPLMTEDEFDRFYPIQELDRFENMMFMFNPLGRDRMATVARNYGYQGRNPYNNHRSIELEAEPGTPVYATMEETIYYHPGDGFLATYWGNYLVYYSNVDLLPHIKAAAQAEERMSLKPGDLIGHTRSHFGGNLVINMTYWRFILHNPPLYAAAHIRNLTFRHETALGYFRNGGGLRGELMNPPRSVLQWQEKVRQEVRRNEIEEYENAVLSMIWVESNGNDSENPDIMNAEHATGRTVNSPEESIERGVAHFASLLRKTEQNRLNDRAAVQAYSSGEGYLDWLIEENIDHTFNFARIYSRGRSNRTIVPFHHPVAAGLGYSWRFDYGNMFYQLMVSQNIMVEAGRLIDVARGELGTEGGEKYLSWLGLNPPVEWSGAFVAWVANEAEYLAQDLVPRTINVGQMKTWFEERGKFIPAYDREYAPQSGDLIFFDFAGGTTGQDRVGIVEFSDGRIIQTIEGNSNGRVRRVTYAMDNVTISGYGITR